MAVDDQVQVLEDEFKLIKSELRQTLVSVRDFLLDLKLPPMQEEIVPLPTQQLPVANEPESLPSLMDNAAAQQPQMGNDSNSNSNGSGNNSDGYGSGDQSQDLMPQMDNAVEDEIIEDLGEIQDIEDEDNGMTSGDIPSDELPEEEPIQEQIPAEVVTSMVRPEEPTSISRINLLANLIRWVSTAKKEIGMEQLGAFLDVYALGGNLSEEIKGVILHLAEVATDSAEAKAGDISQSVNEQILLCMEINGLSGQLPPELRNGIKRLTEIIIQQTTQKNKADIWSKLLLELHGILSGSGNSLRSLSNEYGNNGSEIKDLAQADEENDLKGSKDSTDLDEKTSEELKPEEVPPPKKITKPAKLRLVFPTGDGTEQELDLGNLFIATDSDTQEGNGNNKISVL